MQKHSSTVQGCPSLHAEKSKAHRWKTALCASRIAGRNSVSPSVSKCFALLLGAVIQHARAVFCRQSASACFSWGKLCSSSPFYPRIPGELHGTHTSAGLGALSRAALTEIALPPTRRIKQGQNTWASFTWLDNQTCTACGRMVFNKVRFGPRETQNTGSVLPLCAPS